MCVFFLKRQIIKREQHSEAEHLHKHNGKQVQHSRVGGWLHLHNHNKCVLIKRISFIMFKIVHKMIFLSCERQLHPGKIVWNRLKILSRPRSLLLEYRYATHTYTHCSKLRTFLNSLHSLVQKKQQSVQLFFSEGAGAESHVTALVIHVSEREQGGKGKFAHRAS